MIPFERSLASPELAPEVRTPTREEVVPGTALDAKHRACVLAEDSAAQQRGPAFRSRHTVADEKVDVLLG